MPVRASATDVRTAIKGVMPGMSQRLCVNYLLPMVGLPRSKQVWAQVTAGRSVARTARTVAKLAADGGKQTFPADVVKRLVYWRKLDYKLRE